ncbi:MAG: hypothetical protein KDJ26_03060 [Alphaproteobacteria bacterium]|nr:hypothetical protein [Alphaproteobacteria bacterium]MCB9984138.1 hypothetical protein [Micavibrio sp.]
MTAELKTHVKHNWEQTASGFYHTTQGVNDFMSRRPGRAFDLAAISSLTSTAGIGVYAGATAGASAAFIATLLTFGANVIGSSFGSVALITVADNIEHWTAKHCNRIPTNQALRLQKRGRNLAAAFFVAISVASTGAGVLMVKEFDGQPEHNTGAMSQRFSVDGLNQQDCVVSFSKDNAPKILTGACTVNPS